MIQRSLAELNRKNVRNGDLMLAVRIAINSGPMVIDAAGEIFGELPKVAARAQAVSEPSTQMIATQQRQIPGPLVTEERASPGLKSVPRALRANGIVPARGNGHSMSYHQLITRAVDELERNTGEARQALYERARNALLAQLRSNKPVLVLTDIVKERRALEEAIGQVEADATRKLRIETQELRLAAPPRANSRWRRTSFFRAAQAGPPQSAFGRSAGRSMARRALQRPREITEREVFAKKTGGKRSPRNPRRR